MNYFLPTTLAICLLIGFTTSGQAQELDRGKELVALDEYVAASNAGNCTLAKDKVDVFLTELANSQWSDRLKENFRAGAFGNLGNCYYEAGDDANALAAYKQSASERPKADRTIVKSRVEELSKKLRDSQ